MASLLALLAVSLLATAEGRKPQVVLKAPEVQRLWIDEHKFKPGETDLVRRAFVAAGAVHVGGPAKEDQSNKTVSYDVRDAWDILWTTPTPGRLALPYLAAWQKTNLMPGLTSISKKDALAATLFRAYSQDSYAFLPPTFLLPGDLDRWRRWEDPECSLDSVDEQPSSCLWVLKSNQHLGKGISILPRQEAEAAAEAEHSAPADKKRRHLLAQKYIPDPLLINGRKFGIRLWLVMTSATPLRGYLYPRGLVLFSSSEYDSSGQGLDGGHLTNAFQNAEGQVWTLAQLEAHLGAEDFAGLWLQLVRISGLLLAAAVVECRAEARDLSLRPGSVFQLLGLDFLVDSSLRPWLIEANATPSTSLLGADKTGTEKLRSEKSAMLGDLARLVGTGRHSRMASTAEERELEATCAWEAQEGVGEGEEGQCDHTAHATADYLMARGLSELLAAIGPPGDETLSSSADLQGLACHEAVSATPTAGAECFPCLTASDLREVSALEWELADRGGFLPVMGELQTACGWLDGHARRWDLPCSRADRLSALWMEKRPGSPGRGGSGDAADEADVRLSRGTVILHLKQLTCRG